LREPRTKSESGGHSLRFPVYIYWQYNEGSPTVSVAAKAEFRIPFPLFHRGFSRSKQPMSAPAIARLHFVERESTQSETQIQQDISNLAHALWQQRGCPEGSAGQDWYEAEETVRGIQRPSALTRR
jgi:hypothetical protein